MNLAFPALLVLLLGLPGLIFRYSYARGNWGWSSPVSFRTISDELAYGVVFAVGLHCVWIWVAGWFGYAVDFGAVLALLIGNFGSGSAMYDREVAAVVRHHGAIATYFLTLAAGAWVLGNRLHWAVRRLHLDHRTQILRFKNEWTYLLSSEVLEFRENDDPPRKVDGVYLSGIVDHGKESYLYRGIVVDWTFDSAGQLDTIILIDAFRRPLSRDAEPDTRSTHELHDPRHAPGAVVKPDARYYQIRGDRFTLRYSQLKTLNLEYFSVTPTLVPGSSEAARPASESWPALDTPDTPDVLE